MTQKNLAALAAMSNKYGADADYVLAGGGNTSYKSADRLWVKGSGTALATIKLEDFVVLEREKLAKMWSAAYPEEEAAREAAVLADMMAARVEGENRRPSVETLLHDLFPQPYILHVHPAIVNGLTCSMEGEKAMKRLFPAAVWVDACKPGYILALLCKEKMDAYKAETGKDCKLLFLQNHGIFFAGDTAEETGALAEKTMEILKAAVKREPALGKRKPICRRSFPSLPFSAPFTVNVSPLPLSSWQTRKFWVLIPPLKPFPPIISFTARQSS
jgi:rhamnose utilization protein RhaD (predicted bifunctional aldolase and dehydrogenase)